MTIIRVLPSATGSPPTTYHFSIDTTLPIPPPHPDRYSQLWTGPFHDDALKYACLQSPQIDYGPVPSGKGTLEIRTELRPHRMYYQGAGSTDIRLLRRCNAAWNAAMRERHFRDTDVGTGCTKGGLWGTAARGEKLRRCRVSLIRYTEMERIVKERLRTAQKEGKMDESRRWARDALILGVLLKLEGVFRALVGGEGRGMWKGWIEGLEAQKKVRDRQQWWADRLSVPAAGLGVHEGMIERAVLGPRWDGVS